MGQEIIWVVKLLILPPGGVVLLGVVGLLMGRNSLTGRLLTTLSLVLLYLLSTPYISNQLLREVERYPALSLTEIRHSEADAVVVLGGGRRSKATEFGGDTANALLLERLRYAAFLSRLTGLPVIPSGGSALAEEPAEAQMAKEILEQEFLVPVAAIEAQSRTTWENATMTAALLRRLAFHKVFLVTHAMHMPRSIAMFQRAGIRAIAAPTAFYHHNDATTQLSDWLPEPNALRHSYFALHEMLGGVWYALRQHWESLVD